MRAPMTIRTFKRKMKLLRRWDYVCVVCGRQFENVACITIEHVIPHSRVKNRSKPDNLAPSHWRCNNIKGNKSLLRAVKFIEEKASRLGHTKQFTNWLNAPVPGREVPDFAMFSVLDAEWFML